MPFAGLNSERILILAPHGRDAQIASKLLQEAGWPTWTCADVRRLCEELSRGAAVGVVVEETLQTEALSTMANWVRAQPPWSDFPFVVLTGRGDTSERNVLAKQLQDKLGNATFLERPFHPTTFASVVRSALRSRLRQYYAREVLERRDLLARELQHRTKNLLAVIQAIASASLQESPGREAFFNRLHALAKAQDLIIEGAGRGALMTEVVKNALESFGTRVVVEGPQIFLNPNAAQGFALIMHELGTNAAKHGSLTRKSGTVSVRWSIDASATEPTIVFQWRELGGPTVTPPKRKGFGTILLERAVPTSGIPPRFDYSPEGFSYEVRATLTQQPE